MTLTRVTTAAAPGLTRMEKVSGDVPHASVAALIAHEQSFIALHTPCNFSQCASCAEETRRMSTAR